MGTSEEAFLPSLSLSMIKETLSEFVRSYFNADELLAVLIRVVQGGLLPSARQFAFLQRRVLESDPIGNIGVNCIREFWGNVGKFNRGMIFESVHDETFLCKFLN